MRGQTVVITRDRRGNAELAKRLAAAGATPVEFPTINLRPLTDRSQFLRVLASLSEYDWIIFTSRNGVNFFFEVLQRLGKDARVFASARVAVVGAETAARLEEFGIRADLVPEVFTTTSLARKLIASQNLRNKKVVLLRSVVASKELPSLLAAAGARVDDVPIYAVEKVYNETHWLESRITAGKINWITFASPSAANSFFEQVPAGTVMESPAKVASIGPVTSVSLAKLGVRPDVEAQPHTIAGLIDALRAEALP